MTGPSVRSQGVPGFGLVPLDCPTCGAALDASSGDVVFYCTACRNGYRYVPEKPHLERLEVQFIAAANITAERFLPFWVLEARVEVDRREAGREIRSVMQSLFGGGAGGAPPPTGQVQFVVPAFQADLDSTIELAQCYTRLLPSLGERLGEKLLGGCYGIEDARKLAHFSLIAGEVDRPDILRFLEVSIRFGDARLLGVPFTRAGEIWKDAVHGVAVLDLDT